ncbi:MAG: NAD(+) synthase, partial [Burkholderiales bacterium]
LVLTTGNKSEMATGYATLYGDMAGGFAVLKDVLKTVVYQLSKWRNSQLAIIPQRIITRAPSAELRANQTDQDSLPEYAVLDRIIQLLVEENLSTTQIINQGMDSDSVYQVAHLLKINEYKRRQAAVGPRLSATAFAKDWRYPITNGYKF